MTSTDPIADMLTRVRNAIAVRKTEVVLPHSRVKEMVANVLKEQSIFTNVEVIEGERKTLKIVINEPGTNAGITEIKRLSTPGRRLYVSADDIPTVKRGRGFVVVSTSEGMLEGSVAKAKRLGGELICQVY